MNLSYLSGEEQETASGLAEQGRIKLDAKTAKRIKDMAGNVTEKNLMEMLGSKKETKAASSKTIKVPAEVYERYFINVKAEDVAGIVEEALAAWYGKGGLVGIT